MTVDSRRDGKAFLGLVAGAALVLGGVSAAQAEGPAVSAVNGKVEAMGGTLDGKGAGIAAGSVAFPLGQSFGGQIDVLGGTRDSATLKGFGGHAFWRDPSIGLAGIVGQRVGVGSAWANRIGAEGEYYLPSLTVAGTMGWQSGDIDNSLYAGMDLRLYATDDLALELGASGYSDERVGRIGAEWQPGLDFAPGLTVFADGGVGTSSYRHAMAGVRIYFGGEAKSLKRRHREDDPINPLMGIASRLASEVAAARAKAAGSAGGVSCPPGMVPNPFGPGCV